MNNNSYNIVVHVVNLILLGVIGILAFFSVINISPAQDPIFDIFKFCLLVFCLSCGQLITGYNTRSKNGSYQ